MYPGWGWRTEAAGPAGDPFAVAQPADRVATQRNASPSLSARVTKAPEQQNDQHDDEDPSPDRHL